MCGTVGANHKSQNKDLEGLVELTLFILIVIQTRKQAQGWQRSVCAGFLYCSGPDSELLTLQPEGWGVADSCRSSPTKHRRTKSPAIWPVHSVLHCQSPDRLFCTRLVLISCLVLRPVQLLTLLYPQESLEWGWVPVWREVLLATGGGDAGSGALREHS